MKFLAALPTWLSRTLIVLLGGVAFAALFVAVQLAAALFEFAYGWLLAAPVAAPVSSASPSPPVPWLPGLASLVCFGVMLVACFVFGDEDKVGEAASTQRLTRTAVGCAAGLAAGVIWHGPWWGCAVCGLLFAVAAWYGRAWADHFDFF